MKTPQKGHRLPRTDALIAAIDVPAALGLLTRLPVPLDGERAAARGARAAWAWPIAGLCVNLLAATGASAALWLGLPATVAAMTLIAVQMIVTGAMHEDGLADSIDGLWGGWDRDRRLAIMKDSQIGTYGVLALLVTVLLRWLLWTAVLAVALWPAAIALGALSRVPMIVLAWALPHARASGLSRAVGRPGTATVGLAKVMALLIALICLGCWTLWVVVAMAAAGSVWWAIARTKIGGQTGDILGAAQQLTEIAALIALAALL